MSTPQVAIPLSLSWQPLGVGVQGLTLDQLGEIIAEQLVGSISATVSFYAQGPSTPTQFVTEQFFNTSNNVWYGWNTASAKYLPSTQFQIGQVVNTYNQGDNVNQGWITCNGRPLTSIANISATQLAVLQSLFGVGGNLPNITPLSGLTGLPQNGSFSGITNPAVAPAAATFSGLNVSNPPTQADVQAITANCETLDGSTIVLQEALAAALVVAEKMLDSMNGSTTGPTLYAQVFCGLP